MTDGTWSGWRGSQPRIFILNENDTITNAMNPWWPPQEVIDDMGATAVDWATHMAASQAEMRVRMLHTIKEQKDAIKWLFIILLASFVIIAVETVALIVR